MALPKEKLTVPLGLGLQTDVDPKLLPVGKVPRLENGAWQKGGELVKRPGAFSLGTQYAANTPANMPAAWQLATHKSALVSLSKAGPRPLGVYSVAVNKWAAPAGSSALDSINGVSSKLRGQVLPRRTPVYRANSVGPTTSIYATDHATNGTYELVTWVDIITATNAVIRGQVVELATGKTLFTFRQTATSINAYSRACFVNNELRLVYNDGGANLKYVTWTIANITAGGSGWQAGAAITLAADMGNAWLDVIANGTDMLVIYNGTVTTRIARRDNAGVTTLSNLTAQGGGAVAQGVHGWMRDLSAAGAIAAVCSSTTQGVRVHWNINTATGTTGTSYTIDGAVAVTVAGITGHTISANGTGEFVVLWHTIASPAPITYGRRTVASGISTGNWILRASIASQPFIHAAEFYQLICYESDTQGTYFAIRVPTSPTDSVDACRTPSARFCTGSAPSQGQPIPPSAVALSTHVFLVAQAVRVRLDAVAGFATGLSDTGVDNITLTFDPSTVNSPREFADNLYVCGGLLGAFDGMTFAEEGFHLAPETPSFTTQAGGSMANPGNFEACLVYRYVDDYGRIRRSAPSEPVQFSITGADHGVILACRTLKLHGRPCRINDGGRPGNVVIEAYVTPNNTTGDFHLAAVAENDESVDTVNITITSTDAQIGVGEDLYTNGDNLESQPPPPALSAWAYKDRLAVIPADDPTLVMISLPLSPVEGPRFNDVSSIRIDDGNGDLRVGAASDDRAIVFKDAMIYAILGDGPDVQGNGTFGIAQIIASGIGCSEPRSVVQTPDGPMFRSSATRKGIMMVNRGLAVDEEIGAPVQEHLGQNVTIVDAVHLPGLLLTKFFTSVGVALIYDHTRKTWSTDTNQTAFAATAWKHPSATTERSACSQSSSILFCAVEDYSGATFDDTSSPVEMYVESPWLSIAQLKGYLGFDRIQLVGDQRIVDDSDDPGYIVQVSLFKDFNETAFYTASRTMAVTDDINAVEVRYSAKVSALKVGVRIKMDPADGPNFAGPKLSALVILYKVKLGLRKTASGNRLT